MILAIYFAMLCLKMSKEWSKYANILEREDREFKRVMQEEVSTLFSFEFSRK